MANSKLGLYNLYHVILLANIDQVRSSISLRLSNIINRPGYVPLILNHKTILDLTSLPASWKPFQFIKTKRVNLLTVLQYQCMMYLHIKIKFVSNIWLKPSTLKSSLHKSYPFCIWNTHSNMHEIKSSHIFYNIYYIYSFIGSY